MEKTPNQESAFLNGEADNFYSRNREALELQENSIAVESIARLLTPFKKEISEILEIGCSDGSKLRSICKKLDAIGYGVDPSENAINAGTVNKDDATNINLSVGTSSKLLFDDSKFDVVHFGFCLYLIDRASLFQSISEADRVLKPGGFLIIQDFDPGFRHKRPYAHLEGIFSYKNSYTDLFTSSGHYFEVEKISLSHSQGHFDKNPHERISISLLYKELDAYPHMTN